MSEILTYYIKAVASANGYTGDNLVDHLENGPLYTDEAGLAVDVTEEIAALRLALAEATRGRDEWRRHAEEQLADVLRLRFLGIEFASQYGDRALACKYDNSCDDSGREPACIPCAFRSALGLMGVS